MPPLRIHRALAIAATLSLVSALVVSACPTCEPVPHAAVPPAGACCDGGPAVDDWRAEPESCGCCESDRCDGEAFPDGVLQRPAPATPAAVARAWATLTFDGVGAPDAPPRDHAAPPPLTKLHIQLASFLC